MSSVPIHGPQARLFEPLPLQRITLPNRLIRSATYEGFGDPDGVVSPKLGRLYRRLARGGCGTIISGFVFVSQAGRAMHPRQHGLCTAEQVAAWRQVCTEVRRAHPDVKLLVQLAHTGRQTLSRCTGQPVLGVSTRRCTYFRQRPQVLDDEAIEQIIAQFATSAAMAREAGFDGVQLHAAHGYLVHQFLSPHTNLRRDRWAEPTLFLERVIRAMWAEAGDDLPVLVKLSADEDRRPGQDIERSLEIVAKLEQLGVDAVEVTFGTMEQALNIIRGDCPVDTILEVNPQFNRIPGWIRSIWKALFARRYLDRLIPFEESYNLASAVRLRQATRLPLIVVGGLRSARGMVACLERHGLDAISLSRPLIREPDLPRKIALDVETRATCTSCNLCTIHADSRHTVHCHHPVRPPRLARAPQEGTP